VLLSSTDESRKSALHSYGLFRDQIGFHPITDNALGQTEICFEVFCADDPDYPRARREAGSEG
jgi:hypothetical protein